MFLRLVAAIGKNREIGKNGKMPWDLPDDLKHFRHVTEGKPVIMGRKTYESIGRPLPKRTNIVVSRDPDLKIEGVHTATSLEEALEIAKKENPEEACIIGGAQIYSLALPFADRLSLTIVDGKFDADAFFPEFSKHEWREVSRIHHEKDERHKHAFEFVEWEKKNCSSVQVGKSASGAWNDKI